MSPASSALATSRWRRLQSTKFSRLSVPGSWAYTDASQHATECFVTDEKITVRVTASDQRLEVVVLSKRAGMIEVVLGEGVHSVRCQLSPTRSGMAYVGNAMGREIVYEKSRAEVEADIQRANAIRTDYRR